MSSNFKSFVTFLRQITIGVIALLGLGCTMNKYPPEEFFDGQELAAARAIDSDQIAALPQLVEGLDLNKPARKNMTLLWFAILKQKFEAIELLVRRGARPEEHGIQGLGTAVSYALQNKDTRFLKAMLDGGLSVNHTVEDNTPLIQRAAGADGATLDHVKLLVERGADLDATDSLGETALVAAIDSHQPERAIYLVENGADVNTSNNDGATAMYAVRLRIDRQQSGSELRKKYEKLRDLMISKGAKYPPDPPEKVREWMRSQGMKVSE